MSIHTFRHPHFSTRRMPFWSAHGRSGLSDLLIEVVPYCCLFAAGNGKARLLLKPRRLHHVAPFVRPPAITLKILLRLTVATPSGSVVSKVKSWLSHLAIAQPLRTGRRVPGFFITNNW